MYVENIQRSGMFLKVGGIIGLMLTFSSASKDDNSELGLIERVGHLEGALKKINHEQGLLIKGQQSIIEKQSSEIELLKQEVAEIKRASKQKDDSLKQISKDRRYLMADNEDSKFAFSAYLDHGVSSLGMDQTIIFNKILFNDGGAYNNSSGIYICPENGVYLFFFAVGSGLMHQIVAKLVANGVNQVDAIADSAYHVYHEAHASNMAVLRLAAGTHVWVENYRYANQNYVEGDKTERFTTFSGFLLYK